MTARELTFFIRCVSFKSRIGNPWIEIYSSIIGWWLVNHVPVLPSLCLKCSSLTCRTIEGSNIPIWPALIHAGPSLLTIPGSFMLHYMMDERRGLAEIKAPEQVEMCATASLCCSANGGEITVCPTPVPGVLPSWWLLHQTSGGDQLFPRHEKNVNKTEC